MRATRLFTVYALVIVGLILGLAGLTLYSIEKSRWWDARTHLAQESYRLHLQLEANIFRLFKQHGDALLIGDRDGGTGEDELRARIAQNIIDIRNVIAREIQMVGDEEIEELELLDEIEEDVRSVTAALANFSASGDPIDSAVQIERLAQLLDREIDIKLTHEIDTALEEELEEVEEAIADAAAFHATNQALVFGFIAISIGLLLAALFSFNTQIRRPLIDLRSSVSRLRQAEYDTAIALKGSAEFRELGTVLNEMAQGLAQREATSEEQKRDLESKIDVRTKELQRLVAQLETGEANRRRLMADISHELRTPLAIILGEADVALRTGSGLSDDTSDVLARIRESAKHTNQIVDDMLTVARHESGQLRLDRREIDMRKVLREAVDMFPHQIHVEIPSEPVRASVDEVRLRQSILAVFQNARRYGGPSIVARLQVDAAHIRLTIEDDGPGMTDAEKTQAFDRFFRGSNAASETHQGTGLGLPIVKTIVEAHSGSARLEDGDSGGVRVVIELPRQPRMRIITPQAGTPAAHKSA